MWASLYWFFINTRGSNLRCFALQNWFIAEWRKGSESQFLIQKVYNEHIKDEKIDSIFLSMLTDFSLLRYICEKNYSELWYRLCNLSCQKCRFYVFSLKSCAIFSLLKSEALQYFFSIYIVQCNFFSIFRCDSMCKIAHVSYGLSDN